MNNIRNGRFTSSCIGALMTYDKSGKGWGAPAINYMTEKYYERKLGRCLNNDTSAKPTSWGNLVEQRAFDLLGTEYRLCSTETIIHDKYDFWCGSPDGTRETDIRCVYDIKCPATLKSFCQMVECKTIDEITKEHKEGANYFWQLISNAILLNADRAELIVYCPYKSELEIIRELANNYEGDQNKVAWINWASDNELPYLPDGCIYKNLNIVCFDISSEIKEKLTHRVIAAQEYVNHLLKEEIITI